MSQKDWDFIADNIAFVDEEKAEDAHLRLESFPAAPRTLNLDEFIEGNISRRGVRRGEIGFLKPLMRRDFLDAHQLRYQESLRLGEDYDLYARALTKGLATRSSIAVVTVPSFVAILSAAVTARST